MTIPQHRYVAYDEDLAHRVREQLARERAAWVQRGVDFARSLPAKG